MVVGCFPWHLGSSLSVEAVGEWKDKKECSGNPWWGRLDSWGSLSGLLENHGYVVDRDQALGRLLCVYSHEWRHCCFLLHERTRK